MRLWSLHPSYLDSKGLVALWREALLAQNVLAGKTRGYRNHPQLIRFKSSPDPMGSIAAYLMEVAAEADRRGYHFNKEKILNRPQGHQILLNQGQLDYEFQHLLRKLKQRDILRYEEYKPLKDIQAHPLFLVQNGAVEDWEVI